MAILDLLFRKDKPDEGPDDVRFGRYSDAYKESAQYHHWDESLALFEKGEYLESYERFLDYLTDSDEQNVSYHRKDDLLHFEVIQGSKRLVGFSDGKKIRVETQIAKINQPSESLFKHLLEYNYELRFCRFGMSGEHVVIIFDSTTIDGSPYKLYHALKEAANHADKKDDLIIYEYDEVEHVDHNLFHLIPVARKVVKYTYLIDQIKGTLAFLDSDAINEDSYTGGIAYALLSLAFKLDYLIKPEGYLMDRFEEINTIFFNNDIANVGDKIKLIKDEFRAILKVEPTLLQSEMYWVKSTFGITVPVGHDRIISFIEGELHNMDWYLENEHTVIAESIPAYIYGYALFHYAPPKPDLDLFQLFLRISEDEYFRKLGFNKAYIDAKGRYDRKAIKSAIQNIVEDNDDNYPHLNPDVSILQFGSKAAFAISYLKMIQGLDMTPAR